MNPKLRNPDGLVKGACTIIEKAEYCNDTRSVDSIPLTSYKGKLICKKPMSSQFTYNNMFIPDKSNGSCPQG